MVMAALICSAILIILLAVLNMAERAYLRAHATGTARDLAVAGMQARANGLIVAGETDSLLAETLAQDLFHDPVPPRRRLLARRRTLGSPLPSAQTGQRVGSASTRDETGRAQ